VPTWTVEEGGPIDTPLPQHDVPTHPTTPTTHHGQHEQALTTDASYTTAEQNNGKDTQTEQHVCDHTTITMQGCNDTAGPPSDGTFYANTQHQQVEQPGYYQQQQTSPHLLFSNQGQGNVYPPPHEYGMMGPPGYQQMPMHGFNQGPYYEQQAPFGECNLHGMRPPSSHGLYTYGLDNGYAQPAAYGYQPEVPIYNQWSYMAPPPPPMSHDINYDQGQAYMPPPQCHAPQWHPYNDSQGPAQHYQHPDLVCFDHNGCIIEPPAVFNGQYNGGYAPPAVYAPHPLQQPHNMAYGQNENAYAHPASYGPAPFSMMPQYGHPMDMPYPNAWQPMPSQLPGVPYYTPEG
jgi:hypothetical protein